MSVPDIPDNSLERALKGNIAAVSMFSGETELISNLLMPNQSSVLSESQGDTIERVLKNPQNIQILKLKL